MHDPNPSSVRLGEMLLLFSLNYSELKKSVTRWPCYVRQGSQQETCLDGGGRLNPLTRDVAHAISAIAEKIKDVRELEGLCAFCRPLGGEGRAEAVRRRMA